MNVKCIGIVLESSDDDLIVAANFEKRQLPKIKNYIRHTVVHYDDKDFQSHFRLTKTCVEVLVLLYLCTMLY